MSFDIRQAFFDAETEEVMSDEDRVTYEAEVLALFEKSPEAQALLADDPGRDSFFWVASLIQYGMNYLEITPPEFDKDTLEELLFDIFPGKVTTTDLSATHVIHELRAFWQFLKREHEFENADACLRVLEGDGAIQRFEKAMNDPRNWGMAKSMMMEGHQRGFDLSSEDGINQWMMAKQAEALSGTGAPPMFDSDEDESSSGQRRGASRKKKRKRKIAKASRKKNRKKRK
jgi:hypothetical protein